MPVHPASATPPDATNASAAASDSTATTPGQPSISSRVCVKSTPRLRDQIRAALALPPTPETPAKDPGIFIALDEDWRIECDESGYNLMQRFVPDLKYVNPGKESKQTGPRWRLRGYFGHNLHNLLLAYSSHASITSSTAEMLAAKLDEVTTTINRLSDRIVAAMSADRAAATEALKVELRAGLKDKIRAEINAEPRRGRPKPKPLPADAKVKT